MDNYAESESYLVLTHTVPIERYKIDDEHILQAVRTQKTMFNGFSMDIPHAYYAIMSLPSLNRYSYEVYRDLVIFHSFVCDDPETYDYAERVVENKWPNSKLRTVHRKHYVYERALGPPRKGERKRWRNVRRSNGIDFAQFPLEVYPTDDQLLNQELPKENAHINGWKAITVGTVKPEYQETVDYRRAFQAFRSAKERHGMLYGGICLYVFAGNLRESSTVYGNDYCVTALYVAILEALAGRPPRCEGRPTCDHCNKEILHDNPTWDPHLIAKFGESFKGLRDIRHKFFHGVQYYSLADAMYNFYDAHHDKAELTKEETLTEDELWRTRGEIDRLQKVVRLNLLKSFIIHYFH